jgi:hypothetical protein
MEPLTIRAPTPSYDPQSSKKRTSSPDAPTTRTKKPKTDPEQGHSDKDRRRRRKRKQKKQPIARDSGAHNGAVSGNTLPSSSLTPASPLPSASRSIESRLSLASSQSDRPFDRSSAPPPPLHSSLGSSPHEQRTACAPLRRERVMSASHPECKVRLLSVSVSNFVRTHHSLSTTTKHSFRALYPLSCAKSVSICFTNPLRFPHAGMSLVTAVSSTGSTLISNQMDWKMEVFSAKKHVLIAVQ